MDTATSPSSAFRRAVFEDALGMRHHADGPGGEPLEVFEVRDRFDNDAFERAVRDRVTALGSFHSTWFSQVRAVQRINQNVSKLFVVYDRVTGTRLSTVLSAVKQPLEVNATLCLIRQLVAAIALLHEKLPNVAHGAIAAERVIITPKARLVVSDHVLGAALEQLRHTPDQYWNELRVPLPNELEPTFDQRADVMQIGILALELILGRRVERDDYPVRIHELTEQAWSSSGADGKTLPAELRTWLLRMLQLDTEHAFASAVDAWEDLEHVLLGSDNRASFIALESVVAEYLRGVAAKEEPTHSGRPPSPVTRTAIAVAAATPRVVPPSGDTTAERSLEKPVEKLVAKPVEKVIEQSSDKPVVANPDKTTATAAAPVAATVERITEKVTENITEKVAERNAESHIQKPPSAPELFASLQSSAAGEQSETAVTAPKSRRWIAAAAALAVMLGGGAFFGRQYLMPSAAAEAPGTLVVTTNPAGVPVVIDGQPRGVTPLTVELAPGAHELRLDAEGGPRIIPFNVNSGNTVSQTLELPRVAPSTGQLTVRSEPAGARVTIDGVASGTTPLTIDSLAPGVHKVLLETDISSVTQEVTVEAGTTASLVVPMSTPEGVPLSGWVVVEAPAEVQIFEAGRLIGTSKSDRIMVTAGRHEFDIVSDTLGYHARRAVTVAAGKLSQVRLDWPSGSLAINAQPWADVYINGQRIGETPIGSVSLPIGTHDVTFRHPELGEQVVRATVTAANPTRVSVDMRKR